MRPDFLIMVFLSDRDIRLHYQHGLAESELQQNVLIEVVKFVIYSNG